MGAGFLAFRGTWAAVDTVPVRCLGASAAETAVAQCGGNPARLPLSREWFNVREPDATLDAVNLNVARVAYIHSAPSPSGVTPGVEHPWDRSARLFAPAASTARQRSGPAPTA